MANKKKTVIELLVTLGLVVFLVFLIINTFNKKDKPRTRSTSISISPLEIKEKIVARAKEEEHLTEEDILNLQKKRLDLPWGRDPFHFAKAQEVYKGRPLILRGISVGSKDVAYAYINDQIVKAGETVMGYTILEISKGKVLLKKGNDSFYLTMPEE